MFRIQRAGGSALGRSLRRTFNRRVGGAIVNAAGRVASKAVGKVSSFFKKKKPAARKSLSRRRVTLKNKKKKKPVTLEQLVRRIEKVERRAVEDESQYTYLYNVCGKMDSTAGAQAVTGVLLSNGANIQAVGTTVPFLDTAVPGTPKVLDIFASGQESKVFVSMSHDITFSNGYSTGVYLDIVIYECKRGSSNSPMTLMTNGLNDMGGLAAITEPDVDPWTIPLVSDFYKKKSKYSVFLQSGQEKKISVKVPRFKYDKEADTQSADVYSPLSKAHFIVVRQKGVVGHTATTAAASNRLSSAVSYEIATKWNIHYMSGISGLRRFYRGASQATTASFVTWGADKETNTFAY